MPDIVVVHGRHGYGDRSFDPAQAFGTSLGVGEEIRGLQVACQALARDQFGRRRRRNEWTAEWLTGGRIGNVHLHNQSLRVFERIA